MHRRGGARHKVRKAHRVTRSETADCGSWCVGQNCARALTPA